MVKHFEDSKIESSIYRLEVWVIPFNDELTLQIISEEHDDTSSYNNLPIIIEPEASFELFDYKETTRFDDVIPLLHPVLQSFAITFLIQEACFSQQPEYMRREDFFTEIGLFEISRERDSIFIHKFVPEKNFSDSMFFAKETFFAQESFGGLFPYNLTKGWF